MNLLTAEFAEDAENENEFLNLNYPKSHLYELSVLRAL